MKKSLLTLAVSALLLAACRSTPASSSAATSSTSQDSASGFSTSSSGQDSGYDPADSSIPEEPSISSSSSSDSAQTSGTTQTSKAASGWKEGEAEIIKTILHGIELPSFGIYDYEFESDGEFFDAYGYSDQLDLTAIGAVLQGLNLNVEIDEDYGEIVATLFFEDWSYDYIYIALGEEEDGWTIEIYGAFFQSVPDWPSVAIAEDTVYTGITETIPSFDEAEAYVYYLSGIPEFLDYSVIECYGEDIGEESLQSYDKILNDAGYLFDEDMACYVKGSTYVGVELSPSCLAIYAFGYEEETPSESSGASASGTSGEQVDGWTGEEAARIKEVVGVELPSFGIYDYEFESEEDYFEAIGYVDEIDSLGMRTTLEGLGFTVTIDETYGTIEGYAFEEDWSYAYIYVGFEELDEGYYMDIYGAYFESQPDWPSVAITEDVAYTFVTETIPAFDEAEAYVYYLGSYYGMMYYSAIECYGEDIDEETLATYAKILTDAGFQYDKDYEVYYKGATYVEIYAEEHCLTIYAYGGEEEGGEWGENWDYPDAGEGVFLFLDESQITTKGAKKSVWTAGNSTFTVEKGNSTVDVGNIGSGKEFFSNPLRTYTNQVITIQSETPMSYVEFYVVEDEKSSVENLYYTEPSVGEWFVDEETQTVVLAFEEPVTEVSITLTEGQVRLNCVAITFAK